jgi:nitroimidazol reductase NimA-like FMN-containing flavoprotein (pyridoxamine 5'-phosphate oxidase superfamily)
MLEMTREEIDSLLSDLLIGRLCMADAQGRPYSIPIPYSWIDGAIYLRLPDKGRKALVLAENNRVCFEVDVFTTRLDDYASVLVEGTLEWVTDLAEKKRAREASDRKYTRLRNGYRPGHGRATPLEDLPLRKIVVESISGRKREPAVAAS